MATETTQPAGAELPATMRAWIYSSTKGGLENAMKLAPDYAVPKSFKSLRAGTVLVRILRASVNPADYKVPELPVVGAYIVSHPATPAIDFCGRVVQTATPRFKVGQLVAGQTPALAQHGSLAEYAVASDNECEAVPEGVSIDQAATIGICGATAWTVLVAPLEKLKKEGPEATRAHPRIFINGGSGGVGCYTIQLAKALGCHVTTTCSTGNVELVRQLGADDVVDYKTEDVAEALIKRATVAPGIPFDHAVDLVGMPFSLYKAADKYLAPHAVFARVGFTSVATTAAISARPAFLGGGKRKSPVIMTKISSETLSGLLDLMAKGKISVPVEVLPFEDAPEAYKKLKSHRTRGKIVLRVADDK